MKSKSYQVFTTFILGALLTDIIIHVAGFDLFLAQLLIGIEMRKFIVQILLDDEQQWEYVIFAANQQTACFIAGLKYQREEQQIYAGTKIACHAVSDSRNQ